MKTITAESQIEFSQLELKQGEELEIILHRFYQMSVFVTVGKANGVCYLEITAPKESKQRFEWADISPSGRLYRQ